MSAIIRQKRLNLYKSLRLHRATQTYPKVKCLRRLYATGPGPESAKDRSRPLYERLSAAWRNTPTKWYPLPIAVGALLLVAVDYRKNHLAKEVHVDENGNEVVRLKGPWHVHVIGALPLKNLSRLWGYLNGLELPVWFRPFGFRLYAWIFGCNLEEIDPEDLTQYRSLGEFFYRKLKPGVRPVANAPLVSPADGRVLHFGTIQGSRIEQVKGITYSLDALLGVESPAVSPPATPVEFPQRDMAVVQDEEFANVNGIQYSLDHLLGSSSQSKPSEGQPPAPQKHGERIDASVESEQSLSDTISHDASVAMDMGVRPSLQRRGSISGASVHEGNELFFAVVYLAPGDYHRFHSPAAWVVEKRRHFVGELYSVSPYMARRLENLFVLNERVALLGRWRYGFFSMVPVGATNVGSIKINFDTALRTNVRQRNRPPPGTYTEAVYSAASPLLNGQPLTFAEEMGGFSLGSTIVLVFEAPTSFKFTVKEGEKVKVGQKLGEVVEP
ncbi:phosphatidylserine decarboxylase [Neolentinus lepideus HHB14362 ss-1]|uniref:Phosphatidylserine decarboxylase proenzyme 1, mitochondrial n=1 Tax=Neolentinus lepideus HHB14362 ss-1 TaxID=1314782 RepID=A0A165RWH7_9AGAM|nr:phosphatidylserine decarboxylase [Neolentinus lepideus HHB14362 ss-1]